ncbi:MAG: hypothetical protein K0U98_11940 [Deltaproteobacteria bacterium]|nr:hypothetical protein [Deltaproteobacteria bacterium]
MATFSQIWIQQVADEVQLELNRLFALPGVPVPGSALDQLGLKDGAKIVRDYLAYNEAGCAFHHLLYMITEPNVCLSLENYRTLSRAGKALGIASDEWAKVRVAKG